MSDGALEITLPNDLAGCQTLIEQLANTVNGLRREKQELELAYIDDVLARLLAGETDYAALRPDAWRDTHPEAIREYRVTERRDRADRKQYRRAARRRTRGIPLSS